MNKSAISKYVEEEVLKGKKHQEIFNYIVKDTDFNIHDIASIVRKTPTLEKRIRYQNSNYVLLSVIGLLTVSNLLVLFGVFPGNVYGDSKIGIVSLIIPILLFVGVLKYKRNMHLAAAIVFLVGSVWTIVRLLFNFDAFVIISLIISFSASFLAFYLNAKLVGDYVLDRELQKQNPQQRENSLIFTDI